MFELAIFGTAFLGMITVITVASLKFAQKERIRDGQPKPVYCSDCRHSWEWSILDGDGRKHSKHLRCSVFMDNAGRPKSCGGSLNKEFDCKHFSRKQK